MADNDPHRVVKAKAIELLGAFGNPAYMPLFIKASADSSYTVAGNALEALADLDSTAALALAKKMMKAPTKGELSVAISQLLIKKGDENDFDVVTDNFEKMQLGQQKFQFVAPYAWMLKKVKSTERVKRGVDLLVQFKEAIPKAYREQTDAYFDTALKGIATQKSAEGMKEQADYIHAKLEGGKKGF